MHSTRWTRWVLLIVGAMVLVSCGGSDSTSSSTTVAPAPKVAQATPIALDDLVGIYYWRSAGEWKPALKVDKRDDGYHLMRYNVQNQDWHLDMVVQPVSEGKWTDLLGPEWRSLNPVGLGFQSLIVLHLPPGTVFRGETSETGYLAMTEGGISPLRREASTS